MQWLNVYQTQTGHAMCLLASKQRAISFCGLNQNHCLSQYPAVLVHSHMAFLYLISLWLTMFDCLKFSSFFFLFEGKLEPPSENLWDEAIWTASRENQNCFYRSPLYLSLFLTTCLFPSVREWTGQDRGELGCDAFRAAINKSVPAHALWNPEPLYPFHVFPMSQGPGLWPPGPWLGYLRLRRDSVCVYACVCGYVLAGGVDRGLIISWPHSPSLHHLTPIFISQAIKHTHTQTHTRWSGSTVTSQITSGPAWPHPFHRYLF